MSSDLKKKTVRGVLWSLTGQFSVQGIQFLVSVVLARLLSPDDYGLIGMLAIFLAISQVFIDGGFSSALIQRKDCDDTTYSTVFYINVGISLVCYGILFAAAPFIADFYGQPLLKDIARVSSLSLIIGALSATNTVQLTKRIDFKTQSKINVVSAILSGVTGIAMAYSGFGVWALVAQSVSLALFKLLLTVFCVRWFPSLVFSKRIFKELFSFGSKLVLASLISSVYTNIRSLIIGKRFTPADLGQYTTANKFATLAGTSLSGVLYNVSFPVLSKVQDDDAVLLDAYKRFLSVSAFAIFPLMMLLAGTAEPLIRFLVTDKWLECVPYLQILCFGWMYDCLTRINLNLLYVKGRSDLVLKLEVFKKTIAFTILFISCFMGIIGICIGAAVYSFIAFFCNTYYTKRLLGYGFKEQFLQTLPYLLLSLPVLAVSMLTSSLQLSPLPLILIAVTASVAIYIFLSWILRLSALNELMSILKQLLKK